MSSSNTNQGIRKDLGKLKKEWFEMDPIIRFLDLMSILGIIIFGLAFLLIELLNIPLIATNAGMFVFPLLMSGYIHVLRGKIQNDEVDNSKARREFIFLTAFTIGLILLSLVYSLFISFVVI